VLEGALRHGAGRDAACGRAGGPILTFAKAAPKGV
jgi:hypothetical protein